MAPIVLSEFSLAVDIHGFLDMFWTKPGWYEEFLVGKLLDLSVNIGEWAPSPEQPTAQARTVRSYHPSKISFPGLPSHAESWKVQTLEHFKDADGTVHKVNIKEVNSFRGIPYADYFNVNTEWIVVATAPLDNTTGANSVTAPIAHSGRTVKVTIYLDFLFHKSTWLQGTIESNTKAELIGVYELWLESAQESLRRSLDRRHTTAHNLSSAHLRLATDTQAAGVDIEQGAGATADKETPQGTAGNEDGMQMNNNNNNQQVEILGGEDEDGLDEMGAVRIESGEVTPSASRRSRSNDGSDYPSDEELQFYDCEEEGLHATHSQKSRSRESFGRDRGSSAGVSAGMRKDTLSTELLRFYQHQPEQPLRYSNSKNSTQGDLIQMEDGSAGKELHGHPHTTGSPLDGTTSTRDVAVTIVEAMFVLAEFSYWQVHQMYAYDLKEVFDIEPGKVLSRVFNSFLPGWHSPLLLQPDMYGPVLAVAALPQSLLLSMEISRHGCNPTAQLGNALVVALFIWVGLSALYRLLAIIVAPTIEFKHCLCMTGYGFFAWNVALLCSFPLENFKDSIPIPTMVPLVLFGLPSSIAQGCMFWEHTPASSMTLQPSQLPPSIQQFATTHNRCLQRIVWALPKIIAFVLVAGTHYQFLWYMARVFLPGRRQICRLAALVQPSQYADILTQKELRNFAISLFGKD